MFVVLVVSELAPLFNVRTWIFEKRESFNVAGFETVEFRIVFLPLERQSVILKLKYLFLIVLFLVELRNGQAGCVLSFCIVMGRILLFLS